MRFRRHASHDHTEIGPLTQLLRLVKSSLAGEVAGAEIIVVHRNAGDLVDALPKPNILTCIDAPGDPAEEGATDEVPTTGAVAGVDGSASSFVAALNCLNRSLRQTKSRPRRLVRGRSVLLWLGSGPGSTCEGTTHP